MVLKQRLDQRQVQKLILAPALQQAIKLLPLTNLELIEIIDSELSQNPLLEEETSDRKASEEAGKDDGREEHPEGAEAGAAEEAGEGERPENAVDPDDADFEAHFQEYFDDGFKPYFTERKEAPSLENVLSKSPSLWDHLNCRPI